MVLVMLSSMIMTQQLLIVQKFPPPPTHPPTNSSTETFRIGYTSSAMPPMYTIRSHPGKFWCIDNMATA